jgi:hypothetical protein
MRFPPIASLLPVFVDEAACISWLFENKIIDQVESCSKCGGEVRTADKLFHCRSRNCRSATSIFQNSFFSLSKLRCNEVMLIGYFWLGGSSHSDIMKFTGHSPNTVTAYMRYFRELVSSSLEDDDCMVGGRDIIVEIDESKFGKRKYNRGHRVDGVWVIGGVERTDDRRLFVEVVEDRSAKTLLDVITRHVKSGSIIHTDLWKGYGDVEKTLGFKHKTVNHSLCYVSPEGVHTNTIEGSWNGIKLTIAVRNRNKNDIEDCLLDFIWKRKHKDDLWKGLITALQSIAFLD